MPRSHGRGQHSPRPPSPAHDPRGAPIIARADRATTRKAAPGTARPATGRRTDCDARRGHRTPPHPRQGTLLEPLGCDRFPLTNFLAKWTYIRFLEGVRLMTREAAALFPWPPQRAGRREQRSTGRPDAWTAVDETPARAVLDRAGTRACDAKGRGHSASPSPSPAAARRGYGPSRLQGGAAHGRFLLPLCRLGPSQASSAW